MQRWLHLRKKLQIGSDENHNQNGDAGPHTVTGAVKADAIIDDETDIELKAIDQKDIQVVFDDPDYEDEYGDEEDDDEEEEVEDDAAEDDDAMVF